MRTTRKTPSVKKDRAIEIVANTNCISIEEANKYSDSELKEVLKLLKLKADF